MRSKRKASSRRKFFCSSHPLLSFLLLTNLTDLKTEFGRDLRFEQQTHFRLIYDVFFWILCFIWRSYDLRAVRSVWDSGSLFLRNVESVRKCHIDDNWAGVASRRNRLDKEKLLFWIFLTSGMACGVLRAQKRKWYNQCPPPTTTPTYWTWMAKKDGGKRKELISIALTTPSFSSLMLQASLYRGAYSRFTPY